MVGLGGKPPVGITVCLLEGSEGVRKLFALYRRLARLAEDPHDPALRALDQTPVPFASKRIYIYFSQIPFDRDVTAVFDQILQRARKFPVPPGGAPLITGDRIPGRPPGQHETP